MSEIDPSRSFQGYPVPSRSRVGDALFLRAVAVRTSYDLLMRPLPTDRLELDQEVAKVTAASRLQEYWMAAQATYPNHVTGFRITTYDDTYSEVFRLWATSDVDGIFEVDEESFAVGEDFVRYLPDTEEGETDERVHARLKALVAHLDHATALDKEQTLQVEITPVYPDGMEQVY